MVNGYDDESFRPDSYISREEAAAIVCRGIDAMGISLDSYRLKITFEDENIISDYAVDYVYRLYSSGVINGDENQCFRPKDDMSRAETAQLIWNLINTLNPVESEEQMKVLGKDKKHILFQKTIWIVNKMILILLRANLVRRQQRYRI